MTEEGWGVEMFVVQEVWSGARAFGLGLSCTPGATSRHGVALLGGSDLGRGVVLVHRFIL